MLNILESLKIMQSDMMMKKDIKSGNITYVIPAIYDLLSKENDEDSRRRLNILSLDSGAYNVYQAMEMSRPPNNLPERR